MTRYEAMDKAFENSVVDTNWEPGVYDFGGNLPPIFGMWNFISSTAPFDFDKWDIVYRLTVDADGLEIRRMKP